MLEPHLPADKPQLQLMYVPQPMILHVSVAVSEKSMKVKSEDMFGISLQAFTVFGSDQVL